MIKEIINRIVWFIPFKKFRNDLRELLIYFSNKLDLITEQNKTIIEILNSYDYIIVSISGGFADQIRHYIFGKELEILCNKKVKYDIEWYNNFGRDALGNNNRNFFLIDIFNDLTIASKQEVLFYINNFQASFKNDNIDIYLNNYRRLYFNDEISWPFIIDNKQILLDDIIRKISLDEYMIQKLDSVNINSLNKIRKSQSVAIHIRRGDYITVKKYITEEYFLRAIELIYKRLGNNEKIIFFFFSDEMEWVKENLIPLLHKRYDFELIENDQDKGYIDFYLISCCKYQISSLGHFCDTAYLFNNYENKILITPENIDTL